MQVVYARPSVIRTPGNQTCGIIVHCRTGNFISEIDLLEESTGVESVEKVDALPSGDGKDTRVVWARCESVQFTATDVAIDSVFDDWVTGAEIPPADFAVVSGCCEDVVVAIPDDRFDDAAVDAGTDFIACRGGAIICCCSW